MRDDGGLIVTLRKAGTILQVAPMIGGSITRYTDEEGGVDWLRPASAAGIAARDPEAMACFPLVPFSNRVRHGSFTFEGRIIHLGPPVPGPHAEHGHGWKAAWTIVERSADRLVIEYRHAADLWPFAYRARQAFVLARDRLTITLEILNEAGQAMPVGIGLHPYFPRTPRTRLTAGIQGMWRTDDEVMPVELVDPPPGSDPRAGIVVAATPLDTAFTGWDGRAVIDWPERAATLTMTARGPLGFLVVYTPPGEDFFCGEPVSNCTDAFNLAAVGRVDTGMIALAAGQVARASVTFTTAYRHGGQR